MQRVIWPWETRKWPELKHKLTEKIQSIVEMDGRIASILVGKIRPRQISELFNTYYTDDQYKKDMISQDVFVNKILPFMQSLIENAPKTFRGFNAKLLVPGVQTNIVFTRPQAATIIAAMWFGLFEYNYVSRGQWKVEDFPEPTFINLFSGQNIFILQCILNYFARVCEYMGSEDAAEFAAGNIILKRQVLSEPPDWIKSDKKITEIAIGEGHVDDSPAKMHVAYAHDFIGGDLFKGALTQEEVMLLVRPECLIATLFCARLDETEALIILGSEKMSQYTGTGSSVRFVGNFVDITPRGYSVDETEVMLQNALIFIDASPKTSGVSQYMTEFERDMNKAYCGFSALSFSRPGTQIATGNWAFGFNGNNMQIKFIQQVIAASLADKCIIYHPYGRDFEDKLLPFIDWLERGQFSISELYINYIELIKSSHSGKYSRLNDLDIFECLRE